MRSKLFQFSILITLIGFQPLSAFASDTFRHIELQHRQAESIKQSLLPITNDKVALAAEGNTLIIRGPAQEVDQLAKIINTLDKAREQLHVFIYRGSDPSQIITNKDKAPYQDQHWSTNNGDNNRVDYVVINEGETLIITEKEWLRIPLEAAVGLQTREGLSKKMPLHSFDENNENSAFYFKKDDLLLLESGVELVATVVEKSKANVSEKQKNISLSMTYSLPVSQSENGLLSNPAAAHTSLSMSTVIELDQWQLLSSQARHSEPAAKSHINHKKYKVYSTAKRNDFDYKVWVKFSIL